MLKIFHIGLCVQPEPINGFQKAFIDVVGKENYREISCGDNNLNEKCKSIYDSFKPDIVFMQIQAEGIINIDTVNHFKEAKVINWTGDVRHTVPNWMLELAPYCITSFSNMKDVNTMRANGFKSEYLEIGYDPEIYNPVGEKIACPEIIFMANNYGDQFPLGKYRAEIVRILSRSFDFGVYGNGWSTAKGNINHSQKEEAKYYRSCKIAINCSHFNYPRYSSDRLLRIMGTGAFCLSHKFPDMDYVDGVHLATFDLNSLTDKINYYIRNEKERIQIANQGQQLVLNRNTFTHQVQNIIKICEF